MIKIVFQAGADVYKSAAWSITAAWQKKGSAFTMAPRALCLRLQNVSQPAQRSQLILVRQLCGPICTVLAPPRIGLAPIKPCTLIFPMGFGALIQISLSTNSTSSISGSRTKKQSHCNAWEENLFKVLTALRAWWHCIQRNIYAENICFFLLPTQ